MLPPVPPMPSFAIRSAPSSPSRIRTITTTASRSFPSKTAVAPEQPKKPVEPIHDDHVSSTGPAVISQRSEAAKVAPVTAQETAIAPGLPQTRGPEKPSGKMLGVQMPNPRAESEVEQVIVSDLLSLVYFMLIRLSSAIHARQFPVESIPFFRPNQDRRRTLPTQSPHRRIRLHPPSWRSPTRLTRSLRRPYSRGLLRGTTARASPFFRCGHE